MKEDELTLASCLMAGSLQFQAGAETKIIKKCETYSNSKVYNWFERKVILRTDLANKLNTAGLHLTSRQY